jgi:hypothetical protein
VGILLAGAIERQPGIFAEAELVGIEPSVLAGVNERRCDPARGERMGNWGKLDRFGPGADDQPHIREIQPSP